MNWTKCLKSKVWIIQLTWFWDPARRGKCVFASFHKMQGVKMVKKKTKKINIGASGNGKFALLSRLSRQSTSNSRYKVFFKISCKYRDLYIYIYIKRKKKKKKTSPSLFHGGAGAKQPTGGRKAWDRRRQAVQIAPEAVGSERTSLSQVLYWILNGEIDRILLLSLYC